MIKRIFITAIALLVCTFAPAQTLKEDVLEQIVKANPTTSTLSFSFVQTRHSKMVKNDLVSKGTMAFSSPDKLRWNVQSPYSSLFVLNGKKVLTESAKGKKVLDLATDRRAQAISRNITSSANRPLIDEEKFEVSLMTNESEWIVNLVPRTRDLSQLFKQIVVYAVNPTGTIKKVVLIGVNGDSTTMEFSNVVVGKAIDAKLFEI